MDPFRILLAVGASLALAGAPPALASHNVCHGQGSDEVGEPLAMLGLNGTAGMGGGYLCLGPLAVGVDEQVHAGPEYGAQARVMTCSGLACSEALGYTGVLLVPDTKGPACVDGSCYAIVTCVDDSTCP